MQSERLTGPVVCGVGGSASCYAAARVAASFASRLDAELILLHLIAPTNRTRQPDDGEAALREAALKMTERIATQIPVAVDGRAVVSAGNPTEGLLSFADRHGAAMVVAGTRGLGRLTSVLRGSVSQRIAGRARCPVVVVPRGAKRAPVARPTARCATPTYLCGYDGSEPARAALGHTLELARRLGASVVITHVATTSVPMVAPKSALEDFDPEAMLQSAKRKGACLLQEAAEYAWRECGDRIDVQVKLLHGDPAEELETVAHSRGAALVAVGSRGHGPRAVRAAALGSTSAALVRSSGCPILICSPEVPVRRFFGGSNGEARDADADSGAPRSVAVD
jgi:nucleotide-binding universal stress UspA family protein